MSAFSIELTEVLIYRLDEGVFYAKLVCRNNDELVEIDSRTSDALAMAVRASCKIYTYENILDTAGMFLENESSDSDTSSTSSQKIPTGSSKSSSSDADMRKMTLEELNTLLQTVLEQEDYVRAINIRDEINRRNEK
jgi:bifunctional DNase/RNase